MLTKRTRECDSSITQSAFILQRIRMLDHFISISLSLSNIGVYCVKRVVSFFSLSFLQIKSRLKSFLYILQKENYSRTYSQEKNK